MSIYKRLVLHHTVTSPGTGQLIAHQRKYHLLIDPKTYSKPGSILWLPSVPSNRFTTYAVGGLNSESYSIAVVGDYSKNKPHPDLLHSIAQALAIKCQKLDIHPLNIYSHRFCGQNLVSKPYNTECCGIHLLSELPGIKGKVRDYLWS